MFTLQMSVCKTDRTDGGGGGGAARPSSGTWTECLCDVYTAIHLMVNAFNMELLKGYGVHEHYTNNIHHMTQDQLLGFFFFIKCPLCILVWMNKLYWIYIELILIVLVTFIQIHISRPD